MSDVYSATDVAEARGESERDPLDGQKLEEGMALCLSGGGFKAAIYHLGGLIRLNEMGKLKELKRISSVSGGSITNAHLALQWKDLKFDANGRAANFDELVTAPLIKYCTTQGVDIPSILSGVALPFWSGSDGLTKSLADNLYKSKTLQDFPDPATAPRFVINATNLQLNSLWRFSRTVAADYRVGMIDNPTFKVAKIVAASAGFPPFFTPVKLDISDCVVKAAPGATHNMAPFNENLELGDGGIYDNMGLETIWKRYRTLLVSNAGDPFKELADPPNDWFSQFRRTISMIHRQAENNRVRFLMSLAIDGHRKLALWPLRSRVGKYKMIADGVALSDDEAHLAATEEVRLWKLNRAALRRLLHHGYGVADAAVRGYLKWPNTPKASLPVIAV